MLLIGAVAVAVAVASPAADGDNAVGVDVCWRSCICHWIFNHFKFIFIGELLNCLLSAAVVSLLPFPPHK